MTDTIDTTPRRLRHRPRDARGYVIPFAQFIKPDGTPDFATMDHHKTAEMFAAPRVRDLRRAIGPPHLLRRRAVVRGEPDFLRPADAPRMRDLLP